MTPETRFHATVLGITVFLMFIALSKLYPLIQSFVTMQPILAPVAALLISAGTYSLIARGLIILLRHIRLLKRILLGASYLEGTWIGYTRGSSGEYRWVVEHFEQELTSLVITGRSFAQDGSDHAQWKSEASQIDAHRGQLIYYYICDLFNSNVPLQGICVFNFKRKSVTTPPDIISGYSANVVNNIRVPITEHKIDDSIMDSKVAIRKGKELKLDNLKTTGTSD
jgi:hypothetical protein